MRKGSHHSIKTKNKMSLSAIGKPKSEKTKEKIRKWHIEHPISKENREKMRLGQLGYLISEKTKDKISLTLMGHPVSQATRDKLRMANMGKKYPLRSLEMQREKHPNWHGGISFESYSVNWNNTLRKSVRERDYYICQICNRPGIDVHHTDYCKNHNDLENLITLCHQCHSKTNYNRESWELFFEDIRKFIISRENM